MPYLEIIDFLNRNVIFVVVAIVAIICAVIILVQIGRKRGAQKSEEVEPEPPPKESIKKVKLVLIKKEAEKEPPVLVAEDTKYRTIEDVEAEIAQVGEAVVFFDKEGRYRYKLRTADYETLAFSGGFASHYSCLRAIKQIAAIVEYDIVDRVPRNSTAVPASGIPYFELFDSEGEFMFRLRDQNHNPLLLSLPFRTKTEAHSAIRRACYVATNHFLIDNTKK